MNTRTLAAALAGATLFGLTAQAAPKLKPKANPAVTVTVTVTNSRKADLVQLEAAMSGSANWKKVVGPVKSGQQASAKLPQAGDCPLASLDWDELRSLSVCDRCHKLTFVYPIIFGQR